MEANIIDVDAPNIHQLPPESRIKSTERVIVSPARSIPENRVIITEVPKYREVYIKSETNERQSSDSRTKANDKYVRILDSRVNLKSEHSEISENLHKDIRSLPKIQISEPHEFVEPRGIIKRVEPEEMMHQERVIVADSRSDRGFMSAPVVSSTSIHMRPPPPPPPPKPPRMLQESSRPLEEPSSSIPDLEFDGTTVLCRVCGDKASGFHYGVHSCEGCKGFFRRSIQQKISYRPCSKNQKCAILRVNRNRCQYCRLKKCINVGMSRDAVRFGRVPKREKARILAAMQQSSINRTQLRAFTADLDDQPRLIANILRAHLDTCEFTREKVAAMQTRARENPNYSMPTTNCPLNPAPEMQSEEEFSARFTLVIRGVIDFAGMIPGFQLLCKEDKFTLLRAGLFDALFVRLICMFDSETSNIMCLNGQLMRRNSIQTGPNLRFLVDSTFNFAERLNNMCLTDAEIGLFCAIVLISPDRPGLRNLDLIEIMYAKLKGCLQVVMSQNRPSQPELINELLQTLPDLRTLSTLHTEKLVVFRTGHKDLLRHPTMWVTDEDVKSPAGSPWESDEVKSPLGSVSSTESVSSADVSSDYHSLSSSAPLLAATLTGTCPRNRANSGSSGEEEFAGAAHLAQNGLTITPVVRAAPPSHLRYRKLDSPTDSGIESGNEKHDKQHSSGSSNCSSPRSSLEDHLEEKRHIVEDMPVLKRVLQAPPLYDTNSLMDEAYKPHKKFRAMRQKDSAEAEPAVMASPPHHLAPPLPQQHQQHQQPLSQLHMHLTRPQTSSLSSTHSVLAKSLMEGPRMTPEQIKRTDIIHNYIMRTELTGEASRNHNSAYKASNLMGAQHGAAPSHCTYAQGRWPQFNGTSVITTTSRQTTPSPPVPAPASASASASVSTAYFQSPHSTRTAHSPSPSPLRIHPSSPAPSSPSHAMPHAAPHSHPGLVELQVDIADSQQPLNLSKKSPSPSPTPPPRSFPLGGHSGAPHKLLLEV